MTTVAIPELHLEAVRPAAWRVRATVGGAEVFFESPAALTPRREALACAFLLPAMSVGANLDVPGGLSAGMLENLAFVRRRAIEWWPELSAGAVHAPVTVPEPAGAAAALFYTGGADSSYALQQLHSRIRYAVFVEGFDIPLRDSARLRDTREWVTATTRECGVELLTVRTNLREHPLFRRVSWEITHVAALAAVAHVLGQHIHTIYVAASDVPPPWGSAPDLDRAWSSESLKIENYSADLTRFERVAAIAKWQPVRGRLRVCWENNATDLNCGFCEKCLRTRLQLYVAGAADSLDSFPQDQPLRAALGRLSSVQRELHGQWREILTHLDDPPLRREVERILAGRPYPLWRRGLRRVNRITRNATRRVMGR